jgi:hypothetical protein
MLAPLLLLLALAQSPLPRSEPPNVGYRVRARIDDERGVVTGLVEIRYRHAGPDSLRHLTLALGPNAFRPGARAWPRTGGRHPPSDSTIGFQHIRSLRVDGAPTDVTWPDAPDSGVARVGLPRPVPPGDSVLISLAFESRLPALPQRTDRSGRRMQLIGWHPLVLDEVSGTTVTSPPMATFLVKLDVAADQILGGTGVVRCGDPGWAGAATPRTRVTLQRDWYPRPRDPAAAEAQCDGADAGRKRITWYAEDVPEVALALSPTFRYEEGDFLERPVRVLYERGEETRWGAGLAARRTETALAWATELASPGRYPWPQLTVAQGLGRAAHDLPMLLLADTSSQVRLLEMVGLMITQRMMLGGAPVFTVGTAAFQADWFFEAPGRRDAYARLERQILDWDLDGLARGDEPLGVQSATSPCATASCRRMEFTIHQLRRWAGDDDAMRLLLRTLYQRQLLHPTTPGAFQQAARELIRPDPQPLYRQLPRGGTLYDDALAGVHRDRLPGGGWRTTVIVERRAAGRFPQTVWVIAATDTGVARATALVARETLTVVTRSRPERVLLDPRAESHDWNMQNNERDFGFFGRRLVAGGRPASLYLDTYFSRPTARDRLTVGWAPTLWYNDAGGWTVGVRSRQDYLNRFEQNQLWLSVATGKGRPAGDSARTGIGAALLIRNPVWLRAAGWSEELRLGRFEGRAEAGIEATHRFRSSLSDSTVRSLGLSVRWVSVTDPAWVDPGFYDDAGTAELALVGRLRWNGVRAGLIEARVAGGVAYPNAGATIDRTTYGRVTALAAVRRPIGSAVTVVFRGYVGATTGGPLPRQRRIFLSGADPYERLDSPFLRSRGALLAGPDVHYHAPGGAGVRGLDPRASSDNALGATAELEYAPWRHPHGIVLKRIAIAAFTDVAMGDGDLSGVRGHLVAVADAGVGLRLDQRFAHTSYQMRLEIPLWVSRPALAQDDAGGALGFRWIISLMPSF